MVTEVFDAADCSEFKASFSEPVVRRAPYMRKYFLDDQEC
jgi:hypothetical protein